MALSVFRAMFGNRAYADSVGVHAGGVDNFVSAVLEDHDLDPMLNHHPKTFDDLVEHNFELIVALTEDAYERALLETRTMACDVVFWPMEDPTIIKGNRETRMQAYGQVLEALGHKFRETWGKDTDLDVSDDAHEPPKTKPEETHRRGSVLWKRIRNRLKKLRK